MTSDRPLVDEDESSLSIFYHEDEGRSMSVVPHPIPYQGSKRRLAATILEFVPVDRQVLFEPFCGSAAFSLAAARRGAARSFHLNDSLPSLARLWREIIESPEAVADEYEKIWNAQLPEPRNYYDQVRADFNRDQAPAKLLFLLVRCVKNAVRFNGRGEFNQSPDARRLGTKPERMRTQILGASELLGGRTRVSSGDYEVTLRTATPEDLVYLDPPYQGTSRGRDQRYHQQLDRDRLLRDLEGLMHRGVPVILSFDGRLGDRHYGPELPASLGLHRLEIAAGRSSQGTLNGKKIETFESIYLSPELFHSRVI
jgi:DNA adenine methylase